jgi:hypothetical protein
MLSESQKTIIASMEKGKWYTYRELGVSPRALNELVVARIIVQRVGVTRSSSGYIPIEFALAETYESENHT